MYYAKLDNIRNSTKRDFLSLIRHRARRERSVGESARGRRVYSPFGRKTAGTLRDIFAIANGNYRSAPPAKRAIGE